MENINNEENPLVSVVSAYYNRQDKVIDSINSLLNQTYKNLEIIVIDDGSTDDTYKVLSSLEDPRLKIISQPNQGFVRAIRYAISVSNSEFIAIHGAGDISLPKRIEMQVNLLMGNPDIGVVGCLWWFFITWLVEQHATGSCSAAAPASRSRFGI